MNKNKVDITKIDLEKDRDKITDMPGLIEYAHNVGSAIIKPEDKGKIRGVSVAAMHDQTERQFQQIYKQMQVLVDQAGYLKKRVEVSERIYFAEMGFKPVLNTDYYLYQRKSGEDTLSMVSPREWGKSFPFERFIAHVRLMSDHTWEIIESEEEL